MPLVAGQTYSAYEAVTVAGTSIGLTASSISGKSLAHMTLESAQIRYRIDGTAPTATEGHILDAGDSLTLEGEGTLSNFKAIKTGSSNATLRCSYGS